MSHIAGLTASFPSFSLHIHPQSSYFEKRWTFDLAVGCASVLPFLKAFNQTRLNRYSGRAAPPHLTSWDKRAFQNWVSITNARTS